MQVNHWSEAIAVGSLAGVKKVKSKIGYQNQVTVGGTYTLCEKSEAYAGNFVSESDALKPDNTILWEKKP